ncbi:MAG: RNA polymerase sigma factor [Saprospiraceae bacterium]
MAGIKAKDQTSFKQLYVMYNESLFGMITKIVKRQEEAEEVLQNTFLKIWENIEKYDERKATIFTWMAQIARNTAIDKVRLKSYQNQSKINEIDDYHSEFSVPSEEQNIDLQRLTQKLPDKYKILLDKMFLEGYTQQEISDLLDIPLGTVKTRLRDAIQILRAELKNEKHLIYFLSLIG